MHYADFASARLREIDAALKTTESQIVAGAPQDWVMYQRAVARRAALLEVRELIRTAIGD